MISDLELAAALRRIALRHERAAHAARLRHRTVFRRGCLDPACDHTTPLPDVPTPGAVSADAGRIAAAADLIDPQPESDKA